MEIFVDLVYFGYEWEKDSRELEKEFIEEVSAAFPDAKLEDAYDSIKGYRRSVFIEEEKKEDYLVFILAHGWYNCSLALRIMNDSEKLNRLITRVKQEYSDCIKFRKNKNL